MESYLRSHGASCQIEQQNRKDGYLRGAGCYEAPEDTDCIITIGGDGTLIQAARGLSYRKIPLVGIIRSSIWYWSAKRAFAISRMSSSLLTCVR